MILTGMNRKSVLKGGYRYFLYPTIMAIRDHTVLQSPPICIDDPYPLHVRGGTVHKNLFAFDYAPFFLQLQAFYSKVDITAVNCESI